MERYCTAREATDDNMTPAPSMLDTDKHLEYVPLIAFARQKWMHERASILSYTYIACLVSV